MVTRGEDLSADCFYKNLGIGKTAGDTEIKAAYRKLALKYHPDKNTDSPEKAAEDFKKVSEAYDVLSDKNKREVYDTYGKRGLEGGGGCGGGGFGGHHFMNPDDIFRQFFASNGGGGFHDDFGGFSYHGDGGFGGRGRPGRKREAPVYPTGPEIIPKGTSVTVHSLVGSPEYNGMEGRLVGYDGDRKRYRVNFGESEESNSVWIKSGNFVQLLPNVRLRDVQSRPQLNGCSGAVVGANGDRYHVRLSGSESACVGVGLSNLVLPKEARVHIHSLAGAAQYNGTTGRIVEFLEPENRYLVDVGGNKQLKLKSDNLSL